MLVDITYITNNPIFMIFFSAVAFLFLIGSFPLTGSSRRDKRLEQRIDHVKSQRRRESSSPSQQPSLRRSEPATLFGTLGPLLASALPRPHLLQARLDAAGLKLRYTDYITVVVLLFTSISTISYFLFTLDLITAVLSGAALSMAFFHFFLSNRIAARRKRFLALFPDAIDLIVRGVKSGLPITEAINAIGNEIEDPVGEVFREIHGNIRLGQNLNEALTQAAERLQIQEFRFFVVSLAIQQETGGNISEILGNLSSMIRRREQVRLKIKAMSSEARASALIIGSLPFVMSALIYFVNPDYIMKLFTDDRGIFIIAVGATSLITGILVIGKMVRFKV